jgi:hypothetical protein
MPQRRIFFVKPKTVFLPKPDTIHWEIASSAIEHSMIVLPDCLPAIDNIPPSIYIEYNSREKTISEVANGALICSIS